MFSSSFFINILIRFFLIINKLVRIHVFVRTHRQLFGGFDVHLWTWFWMLLNGLRKLCYGYETWTVEDVKNVRQ